MGSKQVCQHHKDTICLNSAFVQENNATPQDTWGWSSVLAAFRREMFTAWAAMGRGGRERYLLGPSEETRRLRAQQSQQGPVPDGFGP